MRVVCWCGSLDSWPHKQGGSVVNSITSPLVCGVATCLISQYGISLQGQPAGQGIRAAELWLVRGCLGGEIYMKKHHLLTFLLRMGEGTDKKLLADYFG